MTLGEKLKEARGQAGLSQEQLAEKMGISRSAVAKWETDAGIPDIENLKIISRLLDVSIDYLVDNGEVLEKAVIKEAVDLSQFRGTKRGKKNRLVRAKYPDAVIYPLIARKKLSKGERVFNDVLGILTDAPFNSAEIYHGVKEADRQYYLAERQGRAFLVLVTADFMVSRALVQNNGGKFEIGDTVFIKCSYIVK